MTRRPTSSPLFLHDALPIFAQRFHPRFVRETGTREHRIEKRAHVRVARLAIAFERAMNDVRETARQIGHHRFEPRRRLPDEDRKSTRLNSSHVEISYAVFCL